MKVPHLSEQLGDIQGMMGLAMAGCTAAASGC